MSGDIWETSGYSLSFSMVRQLSTLPGWNERFFDFTHQKIMAASNAWNIRHLMRKTQELFVSVWTSICYTTIANDGGNSVSSPPLATHNGLRRFLSPSNRVFGRSVRDFIAKSRRACRIMDDLTDWSSKFETSLPNNFNFRQTKDDLRSVIRYRIRCTPDRRRA